MKHLLITTISAVLLVGCQSASQTTFKTPGISIHEAAEKGNIEAIQKHFDAGTDVNGKDKYGDTPLHIAAARLNPETVIQLIKKGADVNSRTK